MSTGASDLPALARRRPSRWLAGLFLIHLAAAPAVAQTAGPAPVAESTQLSSLPVEGVSPWTRIGDAPAFVFEGDLYCNDNRADAYIGYQGMLGQLEAEHEIEVRAEVEVFANLGGQGAVIEVSRPGLELIVQLYPDRVAIAEREGRDLRWLATASASLIGKSIVTVRKASSLDDVRETLVVHVNDVEVVRAVGHGRGRLGVGRVIFGSLGYESMGATAWTWIDVRAEAPTIETALPEDASSFGALKSGFLR